MEENLIAYEKTIDKKSSFGWDPKFEEEFRTDLNEKVFIPIVEQIFERLDWDLVFKDNKSLMAKRKETSLGVSQWTEAITVSYSQGKVSVKSESLGNEIWDNGRNNKRVKLFIHCFKETEKSFDSESLQELEIETDKKNNWDNYVIPESLPVPNKAKELNFGILLAGGIVVAVALAFIIAEISVFGIYVIGLFEWLVGLAIAFCLKYLIKLSNVTEFKKLQYLLIGMIITIYGLNQYFQYEIILYQNNYERFGFLEFMKLRFEQGLMIKTIETGWIGLVISWVLQLVITYYSGLLSLVSNIISYQLERVPSEVVDFATFYLIKGKSAVETRDELSKMGWSDPRNQDEVFEAIEAIHGVVEINKMT